MTCDWCGAELPVFTEVACEAGSHFLATHITIEINHLTRDASKGAPTEMCDHDCEGPDDEHDVCDTCLYVLRTTIKARKEKQQQ